RTALACGGPGRPAFDARLRTDQVDLVVDAHDGNVPLEPAFELFLDRAGTRRIDVPAIEQVDDDVGPARLRPRAIDAQALDEVLGVAQPRGVDDVQRNPVDLDRLCDAVARGPRNVGDDRDLRAGERIEQRALSHVRLADQHDVQSFAQQ